MALATTSRTTYTTKTAKGTRAKMGAMWARVGRLTCSTGLTTLQGN